MKAHRIAATLIFILSCLSGNSQLSTKLDLRLWNKLQKNELSSQTVRLLVKGEPDGIKRLVEKLGGAFLYNYGNISSVLVPGRNLRAFSESKVVEKIENTQAEGHSLMDTARIQNNIDSVHNGVAPLLNNLKGRGVIVGVIDGGIYWQHLDFRNPSDSSSRIRYIWDQRFYGSNKPLPYNYGNQWNWLEINNGSCAHVPPYRGDSSDAGHGTAIAGVAAGNSLSTKGTTYENQLTGVAPESEIIAVRVNYKENFLSNVADAADYIFKKADALGKPCVINTSIGTYYGSHDGSDLASKMIDAMLLERNGRSIVAAAGNGGSTPYHLSYEIPFDSAFTFFKYISALGQVYFDLWADSANFEAAYFKVGCNDTFGNNLGATDYLNVPFDFNPMPGSGIIIQRNLYSVSNVFLGNIQIQTTSDEGKYHVEFLITPSNRSHYWRLQTTGSGSFDLWSNYNLLGTSDMTSFIKTGDTSNPEVFIQYLSYRHPDTLKTLVSSWQNSDKVITVGNYSNRMGYLNKDSAYIDLTVSPFSELPGKKVRSSSIGPTRDGRIKPDVMATGNYIITTGDANYLNSASSDRVYITKKHIRYGGTSASSPIVAGIAALYLEKRPTATYDEIKQALICTAKSDSFTSNTPNNFYGHGKVNAFAALNAPMSCFTFGAKDTGCINYDPLANSDTGGCIQKIYGCMDSAAENYNSFANVDDGSCTFSVGLTQVEQQSRLIFAFPNPNEGQWLFKFTKSPAKFATIKISNQLGQQLDEISLTPEKMQYEYENNLLLKGLYYYYLYENGKNTFAGKIVVN